MPISEITRNNKCLSLASKYRTARHDLKSDIKRRRMNRDINLKEHMVRVFELDALPRNSSRVRIRNRCRITGRSRAFYRHFGMCGAQIRKKAMKGILPGVQHASW